MSSNCGLDKLGDLDMVIAGVGGQGIIFASRLVAQSCLASGRFVRASETIGMAQRGGSVVSHLRIGGALSQTALRGSTSTPTSAHQPQAEAQLQPAAPAPPASPLVTRGTAALVLAFDLLEACRALPYLRAGGLLLSADCLLTPTGMKRSELRELCDAYLTRLASLPPAARLDWKVLPAEEALARLKTARSLNALMLGAAIASKRLPLEETQLLATLNTKGSPEQQNQNNHAFLEGKKLYANTQPTTI